MCYAHHRTACSSPSSSSLVFEAESLCSTSGSFLFFQSAVKTRRKTQNVENCLQGSDVVTKHMLQSRDYFYILNFCQIKNYPFNSNMLDLLTKHKGKKNPTKEPTLLGLLLLFSGRGWCGGGLRGARSLA